MGVGKLAENIFDADQTLGVVHLFPAPAEQTQHGEAVTKRGEGGRRREIGGVQRDIVNIEVGGRIHDQHLARSRVDRIPHPRSVQAGTARFQRNAIGQDSVWNEPMSLAAYI